MHKSRLAFLGPALLRRIAGIVHPAPKGGSHGKKDSRQAHRSSEGEAYYASCREADSSVQTIHPPHSIAEGAAGGNASSTARAAPVWHAAPPPSFATMTSDKAKIDAFINETTRVFGALALGSIIIRRPQQEANMAFEQKDNSGSVWVNDRKDQDTHPDRTGSAKIDGVDYWVNGWLKKTADGKPYLSLAFKLKQPKPTATNKPRADAGGSTPAFDDAIPFAPEWR
jgi:hypothetical protein